MTFFKEDKFIFPKWTNYVPVVLLVVGISVVVTAHFAPFILSASFLEKNYEPKQPIPYSHALHAGKLGIDCRYCHTGAEQSFEAMVPPTSTCMNCHDKVKTESPHIKKLAEYHAKGEGVPWVRVHELPDYVKFPHQSHVQAGISCQECHGAIEEMEVVRVHSPMSMSWCIQCHRRSSFSVDDLPEDLTTDKGQKELKESKIAEILSEKAISSDKTINQVYKMPWEKALEKHNKKVIHEGHRSLTDKRDFLPPTHCSGCHQ